MEALHRLLERLTFFMHVTSGCILVSMMFVTLADVLSRALFSVTSGSVDWTFVGGVELIKYGLLIAVLFALPHSVNRSQIIVDIFTDTLKTRSKATLEGIFLLGYTLLGSGMSYRFLQLIDEANLSGETTQDLLIPLSYFYGISSFATGILALAALMEALQLFVHGREELPR